jgi:hypothetical protein
MLGFGYTFQFSLIETGDLLPVSACFIFGGFQKKLRHLPKFTQLYYEHH